MPVTVIALRDKGCSYAICTCPLLKAHAYVCHCPQEQGQSECHLPLQAHVFKDMVWSHTIVICTCLLILSLAVVVVAEVMPGVRLVCKMYVL